jgi:hypothetical protein
MVHGPQGSGDGGDQAGLRERKRAEIAENREACRVTPHPLPLMGLRKCR